ncbi:conserved hypothetical protein [delta proteobacterium NaphS2]|nr:conserved hypothetical protein [delta proteobacterium NaphS2]
MQLLWKGHLRCPRYRNYGSGSCCGDVIRNFPPDESSVQEALLLKMVKNIYRQINQLLK